MRKLYMSLVAAAGLVWGHTAGAVTIDFESFGHGDVVSGMTLSGVTITVDNPHQPFDLGVAFDTTVTGSRDKDLQAGAPAWAGGNLSQSMLGFDPMLGNVLIIQERDAGCATGTCSEPDDEAGGGFIDFDFSTPISSFGFDLVDIDSDETGGTVTLFSGMSSKTFRFDELLPVSLFGNRTANTFAPLLAEEHQLGAIDKVRIFFVHSGGIDNLRFEPVPEPATFAMLGLGLLGLAAFRSPPRR